MLHQKLVTLFETLTKVRYLVTMVSKSVTLIILNIMKNTVILNIRTNTAFEYYEEYGYFEY